jgi:hypothetical protein
VRFPDRPLNSIGDLLGHLRTDLATYGGPAWYRGHRDATWHLEPKLLRGASPAAESHLLNRFKQHASLLLDHQPKSEFDWLFLMQHHGISTRLLDWSENPLVGLYFAVSSDTTEDGALWVLFPALLNSLANIRPTFEFEIPSFDDTDLHNYLPSTIATDLRSHLNPVAAIAPRNSARMQAQQGVFTVSHRDNIFIENIGPLGTLQDHVFRYIIPGAAKTEIRQDLNRLGITLFSMFPELGSIASIVE